MYDMRWEVKLAAVQKIVQTCSDIVTAAISSASSEGQQEADPDEFANIAALHQALVDGTGAIGSHHRLDQGSDVLILSSLTASRNPGGGVGGGGTTEHAAHVHRCSPWSSNAVP